MRRWGLKEFILRSHMWAVCIQCKGEGFSKNLELDRWAGCGSCDGLGVIDPALLPTEQIAELLPEQGVRCDGRPVHQSVTYEYVRPESRSFAAEGNLSQDAG